MIQVRPATMDDLVYIDSLQRKNAEELAFYPRAAFEREVEKFRIVLAIINGDPVGYLYHGAFRNNLRIHQACIQYDARGQLYGSALIRHLEDLISASHRTSQMSLRCGSDIEANVFWDRMGFTCEKVSEGGIRRRRDINHWVKLYQPALFDFASVDPSDRKQDASVWRKARKLGMGSNRFVRGKGMADHRTEVERTVGK